MTFLFLINSEMQNHKLHKRRIFEKSPFFLHLKINLPIEMFVRKLAVLGDEKKIKTIKNVIFGFLVWETFLGFKANVGMSTKLSARRNLNIWVKTMFK